MELLRQRAAIFGLVLCGLDVVVLEAVVVGGSFDDVRGEPRVRELELQRQF